MILSFVVEKKLRIVYAEYFTYDFSWKSRFKRNIRRWILNLRFPISSGYDIQEANYDSLENFKWHARIITPGYVGWKRK